MNDITVKVMSTGMVIILVGLATIKAVYSCNEGKGHESPEWIKLAVVVTLFAGIIVSLIGLFGLIWTM